MQRAGDSPDTMPVFADAARPTDALRLALPTGVATYRTGKTRTRCEFRFKPSWVQDAALEALTAVTSDEPVACSEPASAVAEPKPAASRSASITSSKTHVQQKHPLPPSSLTTPAHTASSAGSMDDATLTKWVNEELQIYLERQDDHRLRGVLRQELAHRRATCDGISCSYDVTSTRAGAAAGETLVIAFGGLQQKIGGGQGGGVPPYEFVRACHKAGAKFALFVRDPTRSWYLRGVGGAAAADGHPGGGSSGRLVSSASFDEMLANIAAEVAHLQPARVVTIGSSMGG